MNYLYYSSVKSPLCPKVWAKLKEYPELFSSFTKVDVADPKNKIPGYIETVPTMLIKTPAGQYTKYAGDTVMTWIKQWEDAMKPKPVKNTTPTGSPLANNNVITPPNDGLLSFDPETSGYFSNFESVMGGAMPMGEGTGSFTLLGGGGNPQQQQAQPTQSSHLTQQDSRQPPNGGGNFPQPIETRGTGKADEIKMKMDSLQAQRDMEVPGTVRREGGIPDIGGGQRKVISN